MAPDEGGKKEPWILPAERLDDLTVYGRLVRLGHELEELSRRCWSLRSMTALQATCQVVRSIASALLQTLTTGEGS